MTDLLKGALPDVGLLDQIRCVEREIDMRRRVYPRWVDAGRMKQAVADEEIRRMGAVLVTLRKAWPGNNQNSAETPDNP